MFYEQRCQNNRPFSNFNKLRRNNDYRPFFSILPQEGKVPIAHDSHKVAKIDKQKPISKNRYVI
tara:strand:+ start:157 stop:348 length:192 start_codon:yes stop_codon:yes gene_type:complete